MIEQPLIWRATKNPYVYQEYIPNHGHIKRLNKLALFIVQRTKRIPRWTIQTIACYDDKTVPFATFKSLEAAKLAYRMLPK